MNPLVEQIPVLFQAWHAALTAHRQRMKQRGIIGPITAAVLETPEPEPDELLRLTGRLSFASEGVGIAETPLTDLMRDPFNTDNVQAAEQFAIDFRRKFVARLAYGGLPLAPSPAATKGRKAKSECSVSIDDEGRATINGVPTDRPLTPSQRKVIELMIAAYPGGVLKDKFTANGVEEGSARRILRTLQGRFPEWGEVIAMPSPHGRGIGYRLRPRREHAPQSA